MRMTLQKSRERHKVLFFLLAVSLLGHAVTRRERNEPFDVPYCFLPLELLISDFGNTCLCVGWWGRDD